MPIDVGEVEITLSSQHLRLKVSPYGASLRGLWREAPDGTRQDIVTGYTGAKGKVGGQGDVLIPFPGRVRDGRYTFAGQSYQMNCNDKDGPNAIHGFLRLKPWDVTEQSESAVTFHTTLKADEYPGYPFALRASVTYTLKEGGMVCRFTLENIGERAAPVAAGFHPYFTVGSELIDTNTLQVPMASTLHMENLLPTGQVLPVDGTPYDFRQPRPIGTTQFNTCYLNPLRDPDGLLRLRLGTPNDEKSITVWMDAVFNYVVLYSGDPLPEPHRRRALAIEPMTCGSDAFNHPEWGLITLAPGQTTGGAWGVEA
jgi:aldose 1-epimerase